jgi:hypothetical protein
MPLTSLSFVSNSLATTVSNIPAQVHFEQDGPDLMTVEIVRSRRSPVIASLHRALFALGIVVATYQARARATDLVERVVMQSRDGGSIEAKLTEATRAAIVLIANEDGAGDAGSSSV